MGEYKVANVGGGVVIQNAHENIVAVVGDLARADYYAKVLNAETAPLHERIAELEAAIESAIATAETLLDEPSPYNKVGESIAGWLRRALAKKAGGND
jgi:hypothetical protein